MGTVPAAERWTAPAHWPVYGEGFLMTGVGGVMFVHARTDLTDEAYEHQLRELARMIDDRPEGARVGVVYDMSAGGAIDARRRKRASDVLAPRHQRLAATTAGFALVSGSALLRGSLRAVFWLAPPPYPWTVTATVHEALVYMRERLPGLDVTGVERAYGVQKARFERSVAGRAAR
jgi:hypothetical protein